MREPLLSVIVPVYNTERFLRACLDSILKQVYWNIEVIVVNDASTDKSKNIIMEYRQMDSRIKYVENAENQGLFKARLRGYEQAHGEYICSVDSDDTVGIDYYRIMMKKAIETGSDIVVSKFTIFRYDDNYQLIKTAGRTYGNFAIENIDLQGENILEDFFKTLGKTSHRFIVWNKVYKKSLWDKSYPYLLQLNRNHTMLEDMVFGTVFMSQASRYVYADTNTYFYAKHPAASTGTELEFEQYNKYLSDIFEALRFIEEYLHQIGRYNENAKKFLINVKNHWRVTWTNQIKNVKMTLTARQKDYLISALNQLQPHYKEYGDAAFFYREDTPYDSNFEKLKCLIAKGEIKAVSFDIFDTLVVRPFFTPKDLFILMDKYFWELNNKNDTPEYLRFSEIRVAAEKYARTKHTNIGLNQEVTIDEIYQAISNNYDISIDITNQLKNREKELEIHFCTARKMIKELYEFAKYCGKIIVASSDMYLDRNTISSILEKNGYKVDDIFLSSEIGLTKSSGDLYSYMINKLQLEPYNILHIGDNWNTDNQNAKNKGMLSWFIPSSSDLFLNKIPDNNKMKSRGKFSTYLNQALPKSYLVYWDAKEYFGIRCMFALVANKIFDNAYYGYTWNTDYNMNPYYLGYFALGMHNFGVAHKLLKTALEHNKTKIIFVARDGYAVKQVYDIIAKQYDNAPKSDYIYVSRKALFPLLFKNKQSLYTLKNFINIGTSTIREIIFMLKDLLDIDFEKIKTDFSWENMILDRKLPDENEYIDFIQKLTKYFSEEKTNNFRSEMRGYFANIITKDSIFFDIGYSARTQVILTDLLGFPIDAFYIHKLKDNCEVFAKPRGINIYTYFDYRPSITGKIREVLQSDIIPSCIGYEKNENGEIVPSFEKDTHTYEGNFVMSKIFQGMREFSEDLLTVFDGYQDQLTFDYSEISFAHELLIHNPAGKDTDMFKQIFFEDDMLIGDTRSIQLIWWSDLRKRDLWGKPKGPDPIITPPDNSLIEPYYKIKVPDNSVLYIVTSSFNMLCMFLHKMKYNFDKTCYLLLSEWRMELLDNIKVSGIFDNDKIFVFKDRYVRNQMQNPEFSVPEEKIGMANAYAAFQLVENELPFDLHSFSEINIGNDTIILGVYLIAHRINYNYFEEAIGLFSDPSLQQVSIDSSFPKNERFFCKRFKVFGQNPYAVKKFINYSEQKKEYDPTNTIDFNITKILSELSSEQVSAILTAYGAEVIPVEENVEYDLLLTAPMTVRYHLNQEQNRNLFTELADLFLTGNTSSKLIVKPHPDDKTYYGSIFPDAVIMKKTLISELLPLILNVKYKNAMSVMSTSIGNIKTAIENQILFYTELIEYNNFERIYEYYGAAKIISELIYRKKIKSVYTGGSVSEKMMFNFLNKSDLSTNVNVRSYNNCSPEKCEESIIFCDNYTDMEGCEGNPIIISFTAPPEKVKEKIKMKVRMTYTETGWSKQVDLYLSGAASVLKELEKYYSKRDMKYSRAIIEIFKEE